MTTSTPEDFGIRKPQRFAPPGDDIERERRRDLVRQTWSEVPRHQLNWRMAPEFRVAVDAWTLDRSLVLLGPTGTGKTAAAVRLVARLCKLAVDLGGDHIVPARSLCWTDAGRLTRAGGQDDADAKELLRRAEQARVLVLDDVADGSKTLQDTLRERLRRGHPTLLTSGLRNREELRDRIGGDAVLRHLMEPTGTRWIFVYATKVPR